MKPALEVFATTMRAGVWPSVLEFGALLREVGYEQTEARSLARRYQQALAGTPSGEDQVLALLSSFTLRG